MSSCISTRPAAFQSHFLQLLDSAYIQSRNDASQLCNQSTTQNWEEEDYRDIIIELRKRSAKRRRKKKCESVPVQLEAQIRWDYPFKFILISLPHALIWAVEVEFFTSFHLGPVSKTMTRYRGDESLVHPGTRVFLQCVSITTPLLYVGDGDDGDGELKQGLIIAALVTSF